MIQLSFSVVYVQCFLAFLVGAMAANVDEDPGLIVPMIVLGFVAWALPWLL